MARKAKSFQGITKRIRITGRGKVLRQKPFSNHFLSKKRASRKRTYAKLQTISNSAIRNVKRLGRL